VIVYDAKSESLLHIDDSDDLEGEIDLKMSLLSKYPRTKLAANLMDSHVYVCKRAILETLSAHHFQSIRSDFVPWICQIQYQSRRRERWISVLNTITNSTCTTLQHSTAHLPRPWQANSDQHHTKALQTPDTSMPASPTHSWGDERLVEPSLRCGILIHNLDKGLAIRVNTIPSYFELNRHLLKDDVYVSPGETVDQKAQISSNCIVSATARIGERTTVKQSSIGQHCVIGKNVKITGSVIMDHVVIQDGAKVDNCVLAAYTRVGGHAQLTQCFTQPGFEIAANETLKGEKLDRSDEAWNDSDKED